MNELQQEIYAEEQPQSFVIDSLEKAAWAFKKISACNARIAEVKSYADSEREKLDTWEDKETQRAKNTIESFKLMLANYYFTEKDKNPKFRLSTPYGSGSSRKQAPELIYADNSVERLKELGLTGCVRVKEEVNKTALKELITLTEDNKAVTEDGEVLDFITVHPREDSFNIKGCD